MGRLIKNKKIRSRDVVIACDDVNNESLNDSKNSNSVPYDGNKVNLSVVVVLSVVLSLISGFCGSYLVLDSVTRNTSNDGGIIMSNLSLNETSSISSAIGKVYDAVGVIEVYDEKGSLVSTGTGFVYKIKDNKAYLMTNNHVISGGNSIKVLFPNDNEIEATIVGSDVYSDIAVLSIDKTDDIVSAVMGDSKKSIVGDTVFTVGSPEGSNYAGTVTKGILSAKDRVVEVALANSSSYDYYMDVIQTDAAINPGNSGGPICNINGEVIGITNMKLVDDTVEGMGFAIPIEDALIYATYLEKGEEVVRPYVGIGMLDVTDSLTLYRNSIMLGEDIDSGVVIIEVADDSPASAAKLKKGDVILSLGGVKIEGVAEFRYELYKHKVGESVEVEYIRNNKVKKTTIKLDENK